MLVFVRHGKTAMNADKTESVRSWLPIPLTVDGMEQSRATAERLGRLKPPFELYTSDLIRAIQTAEEVAHVLKVEIIPTEKLRDWNVGSLAGQRIADVLAIIFKLIDDPKKPAPGGESYQKFLDRCRPCVTELIESNKLNIAISHARVVTLIAALAKSKDHSKPDIETLKNKAPIEPAQMLIITPDWKITKV